MPGPNIQSARAAEHDVERFEVCALCDKPSVVYMRVFDQGEPYWWCLKCLAEAIKDEISA
jgi:hypothetical protein